MKYRITFVPFTFSLKCFIQLRRPSDGAVSEPIAFEYYSPNRGRRSILALRKSLKAQNSLELNLGEKQVEVAPIANGIHKDDACTMKTEAINCNLTEPNIVPDMDVINSTEKTSKWLEKTEFDAKSTECECTTFSPQNDSTFNYDTKTVSPIVSNFDGEKSAASYSEMSNDIDQTLNDLLEQVAELDEIYSGYQTKRDGKMTEIKAINGNESFDFDDTATYTSLQRAFKNPIPIYDPEPKLFNENVQPFEPPFNSLPPIPTDLSPLKRNDNLVEEEKLPPLPPKRLRKITAENTEYNANLLPLPNQNDGSQMSQIIIKRSPDNRSPASSTTNSAQTSPQKKQGFFSRIFRRKSKSDVSSNAVIESKNSPNLSRESSFTNIEGFDRNRTSTRSFKLPQSPTKKSKPVGRSVSSVSGKRPHLTADIVHIPLKGNGSDGGLPIRSGSGNLLPEHYMSNVTLSNNLDRKTVSALQLADIPFNDGNMELVAIADAQSLKNLCEGQYGVHLDDDVDLSEAEHFALYTSAAPHATQSEFDEMSAFYAPIEAAEAVPNAEIAKRLALSGSPKKLH